MLSDCQQKVVEKFKNHKGHMTIRGPAGVGKSFITKHLIDSCEDKNGIFLATPTHQAKIVLNEMTNMGVSTLHSLLKIHPQTYEDVKTFEQSEDPELQDCRILFIDEASMVDDDLFNILMSSIHPHCRVIAIGDHHQLQPVKHDPGHLSPFFTDSGFLQIEMNTILRQAADNPIIQVATGIRNGGELYHLTKEGKGVYGLPDIGTMFKLFFNKVKTADDLLDYRMLAFTNNVVNKSNEAIRDHIYKTDKPYIEGEYLVMQAPVMFKEKYKGITVVETLFNNGQTVRVETISPVQSFTLSMHGMNKRVIETYTLGCLDMQTDKVKPITVFASEDDEIATDMFLQESVSKIRELKGKAAGAAWAQFWKIKETFAETKPLGACTVHKSQGITVKGIVYYTQDKSYADTLIQRQLDYVACTRPTDFIAFR
ncbi:MAG: hypothetical protein [Caudoviricetes sp.]|nr:MAG: hypothetical protein [Caudoviricetes sp.]